MRVVTALLCFLSLSVFLFAQAPGSPAVEAVSAPVLPPIPSEDPLFSDTGDAAIARRYREWAEREYKAGRTAEALAALERGADYASASSDLSFVLAKLRLEAGRSRFTALEACRAALQTQRWERYTPEDARLLEANILTELRFFEEALAVLERCDAGRYETHYRRLLALRGLVESLDRGEAELNAAFSLVMDRFPRETGPIRVLFEYAARREGGDPRSPLRQSVDAALRRLPVLVQLDPELACLAVPFIYDKEIARSYAASYRAVGNPRPDSLPAALRLGLVSGEQAVEELFAWRDSLNSNEAAGAGKAAAPKDSGAVINRELILTIDALLGDESSRELLGRNLSRFSGVIVEDGDYDGIAEAWVRYDDGMIRSYRYDSDQDGEADLFISFAQGIPAEAEIAIEPVYAAEREAPGNPEGVLGMESSPLPVVPAVSPLAPAAVPGKKALLRWERYPSVLDTELEGKRYIPRPLDYFYTPLRFAPLAANGPDYPEREALLPVVTERSLLSFSVIMEQPSADFPGAIERVELSEGIPLKASVVVDGKKVSETEFRLGKPVIQYLDSDADGRTETIRRYDPTVPYKVLSIESDRDGDGSYEYKETLWEDGSAEKAWDFDRDGIRETER